MGLTLRSATARMTAIKLQPTTDMPKENDTKTRETSAVAAAPACSTLDGAIALIRAQEYIISRQRDVTDVAVKRFDKAVRVGEAYARENHKLRKELEGYKRGRLWTMIASILPTMELRYRDDK